MALSQVKEALRFPGFGLPFREGELFLSNLQSALLIEF